MALATPTTYEPRDPSNTVLYKVVAEHLETFLASLDADPDPVFSRRDYWNRL